MEASSPPLVDTTHGLLRPLSSIELRIRAIAVGLARHHSATRHRSAIRRLLRRQRRRSVITVMKSVESPHERRGNNKGGAGAPCSG